MNIHLDNHEVARPSDHLIAQMTPMARRHWKSTQAAYLDGKEPHTSIAKAYERISTLFGGGMISVTSDPIAHLYTALFVDYIKPSGKNQVITPDPLHLEGLGCVCKPLDIASLESLITPRTGLISLPWASSETGVIHPIWDIIELCKKHNILLHVDASQVVGKLFFQFESMGIDFLTFTATPFHGPKGIGGIIANRPLSIPEGEPNLPALIGLGIACEEAVDSLDHLCLETPRLRSLLEPLGKPLFTDRERLPHIAAIAFPGIHPELLQFALAKQGIYVGRTDDYLSFALSRETTEEEIRHTIGSIQDTLKNYESILEQTH